MSTTQKMILGAGIIAWLVLIVVLVVKKEKYKKNIDRDMGMENMGMENMGMGDMDMENMDMENMGMNGYRFGQGSTRYWDPKYRFKDPKYKAPYEYPYGMEYPY